MAVAVVILLIAVIVTVSNSSFQKKLLSRAVEELQLKLGTHVGIDSVSINVFTLDVSLYGIEIEDLEKRKMLQLEQVTVDLELLKLLNKKVVIEKAEAIGANALLEAQGPEARGEGQEEQDGAGRQFCQAEGYPRQAQ